MIQRMEVAMMGEVVSNYKNSDEEPLDDTTIAKFEENLNELDEDSKIYSVHVLADVDKPKAISLLKGNEWNVALALRAIEIEKNQRRYCTITILLTSLTAMLVIYFFVSLWPQYTDPIVSQRQGFEDSKDHPQPLPVVAFYVWASNAYKHTSIGEVTLKRRDPITDDMEYDSYCGRPCGKYDTVNGCLDCYTSMDDHMVCDGGSSALLESWSDFNWRFCADQNPPQMRKSCPRSLPIMIDQPLSGGGGTDYSCDAVDKADLKAYGGLRQCRDGTHPAIFESNCTITKSLGSRTRPIQPDEHIVHYDGANKWDFIIPPHDWVLDETSSTYFIQMRYNFSHMANHTFEESRRVVDTLDALSWDAMVSILDKDVLVQNGILSNEDEMPNNWTINDFAQKIYDQDVDMHLDVASQVIRSGSRMKVTMQPEITIDIDGSADTHRLYTTIPTSEEYMPYVVQLEISLSSNRVYVIENYEIAFDEWELLSKLGGVFSLASAFFNIALAIVVLGVWFPRCCGMDYHRKLFGYHNIPFDFKRRRQLDAYFDVFGGEVGKDLLVKEQALHYDLKTSFKRNPKRSKTKRDASNQAGNAAIQTKQNGGSIPPH